MNPVPLPKGFEKSLSMIDEVHRKQLMDALEDKSPTSIRINSRKFDFDGELETVHWSDHGYYLQERPTFNSDPFWHAGVYYVQEASSMVIGSIVGKLRKQFEGNIRVLDLCASPGGKSTDIADALLEVDVLVSNDVINSRVRPLQENVVRWGKLNHFITNQDAKYFQQKSGLFDLMVIDAPCSGEGMFRKDPKARTEWSEDLIRLCHARQVRILNDSWSTLKEGGYLIYSTCTFNEIENELTISKFLESNDAELVELDFDEAWNIHQNGTGFFRLFPNLCRGEGFSFCVLKKLEEAPRPKRKMSSKKPKSIQMFDMDLVERDGSLFPASIDLVSDLDVIYSGMELGVFKKSKFLPAHRLAMLSSVNFQIEFRESELTYSQSIQFLRKEGFELGGEKGFTLLKYRNQNLGWINHLGNRFNNLYPTNMRILTRADYTQDPNIL